MGEYREIILTGSPGAGKSSALGDLIDFLGQKGYRVLAAPEIATLLWSGGLSDRSQIEVSDPEQYQRIQSAILSLHLDFRRHLQEIAAGFDSEKPVCILHDRGPWDSRPYMEKQSFLRLFQEKGLDPQALREGYDLVIHMRTAAVLDPDLYSKAGNPQREESAEEARRTDKAALQAWVGHPHLRIVEAMPTVEQKLQVVRSLVLQAMEQGESHIETEHKFLLSRAPSSFQLQEAGADRVEIEQTYLRSDGPTERRVRKRQGRFGVSYSYTEKSEISDTQRLEKEQTISEAEYNQLLEQQDPSLETLRKTRYHFAYSYHHFELDYFADHHLWILELELHSSSGNYTLPPWLKIDREVTSEKAFRSIALARKKAHPGDAKPE